MLMELLRLKDVQCMLGHGSLRYTFILHLKLKCHRLLRNTALAKLLTLYIVHSSVFVIKDGRNTLALAQKYLITLMTSQRKNKDLFYFIGNKA